MNTAQQQPAALHAPQIDLFAELPTRIKRSRPASAEIRKANGQFLAAKKAGLAWQENTLAQLVKFIKMVKSRARFPIFTFEEFRVYCEAERCPAPHHVNAWGPLPGIAQRRGLVTWTGQYVPAIRPESHGRTIKTWVAN